MVRKANFVEVVGLVLFTEKGTKQKNGVCVNADEFNLRVEFKGGKQRFGYSQQW